MKQPLHPVTRILVAIAALAMIGGFFLPLWEIQLWAPQYPEGLNMKIWLDRIGGDYEIINGLNHYIGMKHIKQEMFPEFLYMGYVLTFMIALGLLPPILGTRRWLVIFTAILFLGAGLGLYDFWRWGYDYGHNLDPKAAISVPGMSYQPPVIGYKSLLNFVAYSGPDKGGWLLIASGALTTLLLILELGWLKKILRRKPRSGTLATFAITFLSLGLSACKPAPLALTHGKDTCDECKMLLVDPRYGSAFVTAKGKIFKFDDVNCLTKYIRENADTPGTAHVIDSTGTNHLLPVTHALFLKHEKLRTPMNSTIAAFPDEPAARAADSELGGGGKILSWEQASKNVSDEACQCDESSSH
ncbi:MAG: nitrous oxide reductase accessory protein NosL [Luteolibacter sp.]